MANKRRPRPQVKQRTVDMYDWLRDVLLFSGGLFGVIHETIVSKPRAELLSVYTLMMAGPGLSMLRNGVHRKEEAE